MSELAYNLLTEPLVDTDQGLLSLPGVFAAMARGDLTRFDALRPHQRPAWHMFLVQLGVLALDAGGLRDLPEDQATWRQLLRGLSADHPDDAPWCLIAPEKRRHFCSHLGLRPR